MNQLVLYHESDEAECKKVECVLIDGIKNAHGLPTWKHARKTRQNVIDSLYAWAVILHRRVERGKVHQRWDKTMMTIATRRWHPGRHGTAPSSFVSAGALIS